MARRLPSVAYEPSGEPSLFDRWESGTDTELLPPLAVCDAEYRSEVVRTLGRYRHGGRHLVSVGAGNGHVEAALAADGWQVLATDLAPSALRICRAKGLATASFDLMEDTPMGQFDAIYCDGVMGHLWHPASALIPAWTALAGLGHAGSICVVSNDLSDDDETPRFAVRMAPSARFYRPPAGWFGRDARSTSLWSVESEQIYEYVRAGTERRREIIVARLLVDERVAPEDPS